MFVVQHWPVAPQGPVLGKSLWEVRWRDGPVAVLCAPATSPCTNSRSPLYPVSCHPMNCHTLPYVHASTLHAGTVDNSTPYWDIAHMVLGSLLVSDQLVGAIQVIYTPLKPFSTLFYEMHYWVTMKSSQTLFEKSREKHFCVECRQTITVQDLFQFLTVSFACGRYHRSTRSIIHFKSGHFCAPSKYAVNAGVSNASFKKYD